MILTQISTLIAVFTWNLEKIYIPPDGKGGSDGIVRQKAVPEYGKGARNPDYRFIVFPFRLNLRPLEQ